MTSAFVCIIKMPTKKIWKRYVLLYQLKNADNMEAIFKINVNQIDNGFVDSIKKMFKQKELIIRISASEDESEYLLSSDANKKHILDNISTEPSIRFTGKEFEKYIAQI